MTITDHAPVSTPIHASELRQLIQEDPLTRILDVRTGAEFESVHIPGSYNVPLDMLAEHVAEFAELDHPVVLVCQSGGRATTAHDHLHTAGKTNLRILEGGMGGWLSTGGETVKGAEKWGLDRQVRGVAGAMVLTATLAGITFPKARFIAGGVGFGLFFSAVSNTCAMGMLLAKLPYNKGPRCDLDRVLEEMTSE